MLDLTPDECQLVANALNVLAQRDGLSQPRQYAMSTQIVAKIQEALKRQSEVAMAPDDADVEAIAAGVVISDAVTEADLEAGSGAADV